MFFTKEGEPEPKAEVKKLDEEAKAEEEEDKGKAKKKKKKPKPKLKYVTGLIMVDTFSNYCVLVILPAGKTTGSVTAG